MAITQSVSPSSCPSAWKFTATYEGLINQAMMLFYGMKTPGKIPGVQGAELTDEAMTPFGVTLYDFDYEAIRTEEGTNVNADLDQNRNHLAWLCGYSDYTHMVSLSVVASEYWSARYVGRAPYGKDVVEVNHRGFLKKLVENLAPRIGVEFDALWQFPFNYLEPTTEIKAEDLHIEIPSRAWGLRDIEGNLYKVTSAEGDSGAVPFVTTLPVSQMMSSVCLAFLTQEVEVVGKEFANFGGMSFTVPYSLKTCQADLGFKRKPEKMLFCLTVPQYAEHEVVEVYEHSKPEYVVVLFHQLKGDVVRGYKIDRSIWLEALRNLNAKYENPQGEEESFVVLSALVEGAEDSWESPEPD